MNMRRGTLYAGVVTFFTITWMVGTARLDLALYRILVLTLVGGCILGVIGMGIAGMRARK